MHPHSRAAQSLVPSRARTFPLCLAVCLALVLGAASVTGCKSDAPAAPAEREPSTAPPIPDPLPSDPKEALDALFALPHASHFGNPATNAQSVRRLLDAVDRVARQSEDPARLVAVQTALGVLQVTPTPGAYASARNEWRRIRGRI